MQLSNEAYPLKAIIKERLSTHYLPLDGIRGLAILLVMSEHLFLFTVHSWWEYPLSWVFDTGWIGVDLFFVLSGFLITGILYKAKSSKSYLKDFYLRRVKRIFPLNYLYLTIFTFGVMWLGYFSHGKLNEKADQSLRELPWVWVFCTNIIIAKKGAFITSSINHFWSLAVEEQFYLIWPFFILFLNRINLIKVCIFFLGG